MKKEKKVRTYQRRTKTGKMVTVRAHTASYEAADKAKEAAKKKGAGEELSSKVKKGEEWKLPMDEFLKKLKEERAQKRDEESEKVENEKPKESEKKTEKKTTKKRTVGTGTNGPEPKKKTTTKKTAAKADTSEPAFTAAEFKEWYRGTGSDADKKVAKALRAQLGRAGYRKLEDEAIDNYSSRGHLSMFKRVSGGSEVPDKTKKAEPYANYKALAKKRPSPTPPKSYDPTAKDKESKISSTTGDYHKSVVNRAIKYALTDVDKAKDYMDRKGVDHKHQEQILAGNYEVSPERGKEGFIRVGIKESQRPYVSSDNELIRNPHRKRPLTITLPREKKNVHSKSSASSFMDGYKDMNALREYASQVMDSTTPYKAKTMKELKRMFDADQGNDGSHEKKFKKFLKDEWLPNKDNVQGDRNFYLGIKTPKRKSWENQSGKLMTERMRLNMEGKGMSRPLNKKSDYKDPVGEGVKRKNPKPIVTRSFTTIAARNYAIERDKNRYNTLKDSGWKTKRKNGNYYLISPDGSKMVDVAMHEKFGLGNRIVRIGQVLGRPRKNTL